MQFHKTLGLQFWILRFIVRFQPIFSIRRLDLWASACTNRPPENCR